MRLQRLSATMQNRGNEITFELDGTYPRYKLIPIENGYFVVTTTADQNGRGLPARLFRLRCE